MDRLAFVAAAFTTMFENLVVPRAVLLAAQLGVGPLLSTFFLLVRLMPDLGSTARFQGVQPTFRSVGTGMVV